MKTLEFYNIIDKEIDALLERYKEDAFIQKHKTSINNQKSYALLIWFLEFYGRKSNYSDFITDGSDDSSCDIILDRFDNQNNQQFYIVQSKWNNSNNAEKDTNKDEILKSLSDFTTIMRGEKRNANPKLKEKLKKLDLHLKSNGEVKFIFLSLSQYNGGADDNIQTFINHDDKIKFEIIDINRIRTDYIDRKYKNIKPLNPLEKYLNPEEVPISINISQEHKNFIKIERPFEAYMVLLKPKSVYDLFAQYGFALFYKNVRNPLLQSQFNEQIEKTAIKDPAFFWYYNNGITAITYMLPSIGNNATKIEVTGLQIINGTQTVYSIYRAYKSASPAKRKQMDSEALVTLRILKSGGESFDLNVTRFTNSQNPVNDRDFCANDNIQIKLQNSSYETKIWYEKRRDEFRTIPDGILKVPNYIFANVYLAYHLQDPDSVLKNHSQGKNTDKNLNFISHKDHKDGAYEKIFNSNTVFSDMLCSFYVFDTIEKTVSFSPKTNIYRFLAWFNVTFTKYLKNKFNDKINVNKYIIDIYEKGDKEIIIKTSKYIQQFIEKQASENYDTINEKRSRIVYYERVKEELEKTVINPEDIENIVLKDKEETNT